MSAIHNKTDRHKHSRGNCVGSSSSRLAARRRPLLCSFLLVPQQRGTHLYSQSRVLNLDPELQQSEIETAQDVSEGLLHVTVALNAGAAQLQERSIFLKGQGNSN